MSYLLIIQHLDKWTYMDTSVAMTRKVRMKVRMKARMKVKKHTWIHHSLKYNTMCFHVLKLTMHSQELTFHTRYSWLLTLRKFYTTTIIVRGDLTTYTDRILIRVLEVCGERFIHITKGYIFHQVLFTVSLMAENVFYKCHEPTTAHP